MESVGDEIELVRGVQVRFGLKWIVGTGAVFVCWVLLWCFVGKGLWNVEILGIMELLTLVRTKLVLLLAHMFCIAVCFSMMLASQIA